MKVCILTTSFPLGHGDLSGIFILEQGRHLVKQGIKVVVVAPHHPGAPKHEVMDGMSVHRFPYFLPEKLQKLCYGSGMPYNLKESSWSQIQLPFLLATFIFQAIRHARHCDIIHAHWSLAGLAGLIASKISGKPIVLTMHHGNTQTLTKIEKVVLEQVDYVLCNSAFTLSHVLETAKPKVTKVIPHGIDTRTFQSQTENMANGHLPKELPAEHLVILTIGRLIELKGHKYLLEAFRQLPEDTHTHLLIGGDGGLRQTLENQVEQSGLSDRVTFLGHVPNHLTPLYYRRADIYAQPSIIDKDGNTEGLGMTLLEAMSCETPCVGSRTGGIPEIVLDGKTGFLVEPKDSLQLAEKISILLRDKDLRMNMGKQGRRLVEDNYSWEVKAKELVEIYDDLAHQEKRHKVHLNK
ncbi:MAG: glycosyltransferase family 4 protein [Pseudomonadota bacterium]